jgi:hypothetical protein
MARTKRPPVVWPEIKAGSAREVYSVPRVFRPATSTPPGRYPLLKVFVGLEKTVPFQKYPGDDRRTLEIAKRTSVALFDGPGWMYVAPPKTPPEVLSRGFRMVETTKDVIVVARSHLANSPRIDVYLDIIHEFLHILQRKQGREIWPHRRIAYVDRPTEIEAYAFSIAEARRLGVPDTYLREYLSVPWLGKGDFQRFLGNVGVTSGAPKRPRRRAK